MARILIINDEPDLVEMCALVLESAGHFVTRLVAPTSAGDVIDAATSPRADVVLLDLVMPHATGERIFRLLREEAETADVPVVVMSALPDLRNIAEGMGAEGILEKPFEPDALVRVVSSAIATRTDRSQAPARESRSRGRRQAGALRK